MNRSRLQTVLDFIKQNPDAYDHTADLRADEPPTPESPKCVASIAAYFNRGCALFREFPPDMETLILANQYLETDQSKFEEALFHVTWHEEEPDVELVMDAVKRILKGADVVNAIDQTMMNEAYWRNAEPGTEPYQELAEEIARPTEFWRNAQAELAEIRRHMERTSLHK